MKQTGVRQVGHRTPAAKDWKRVAAKKQWMMVMTMVAVEEEGEGKKGERGAEGGWNGVQTTLDTVRRDVQHTENDSGLSYHTEHTRMHCKGPWRHRYNA